MRQRGGRRESQDSRGGAGRSAASASPEEDASGSGSGSESSEEDAAPSVPQGPLRVKLFLFEFGQNDTKVDSGS
eukprot:CAMPEP_0170636712 /NCGR_PEP_ID=MMETSP0224-20130122/37981_1 /TAXON_ID=285029 /ORGANISM="Togula jolla, Strain CCCM 725" /LENGTH=73 /DNA_ID=CAMNT_0010966457 /DNA_START=10 /DNA_END=227 /DNA_ORIENTATION=+